MARAGWPDPKPTKPTKSAKLADQRVAAKRAPDKPKTTN
jgi:hypothetical protein